MPRPFRCSCLDIMRAYAYAIPAIHGRRRTRHAMRYGADKWRARALPCADILAALPCPRIRRRCRRRSRLKRYLLRATRDDIIFLHQVIFTLVIFSFIHYFHRQLSYAPLTSAAFAFDFGYFTLITPTACDDASAPRYRRCRHARVRKSACLRLLLYSAMRAPYLSRAHICRAFFTSFHTVSPEW